MAVVGKTPNQHRRVRVKTSSSKNIQSVNTNTPSPQQVASYISEMCLELVLMAKGANLTLVAHLLAMAQAEADCAVEYVN